MMGSKVERNNCVDICARRAWFQAEGSKERFGSSPLDLMCPDDAVTLSASKDHASRTPQLAIFGRSSQSISISRTERDDSERAEAHSDYGKSFHGLSTTKGSA
jgi:hypothetical protein